MIENPELLARVLAAPDDDEPRLVYADWLQENGDEAPDGFQIDRRRDQVRVQGGLRPAARAPAPF